MHLFAQSGWSQKGVDISEVVVVAKSVLAQWQAAQDRNFDLSLNLADVSDGATRWLTPTGNTIKINSDAALFAQSGCFSMAWVARDSLGNLIEARARCLLGKPDPEVAEILGIKEVLSWIKMERVQNVVVESDCWVAIQAIRSSTTLFSYFGRIVNDCRRLLLDLKVLNVSLLFVKRSANTVVDFLAKATSSIADRSWRGDDVPSELAYVLCKDLI